MALSKPAQTLMNFGDPKAHKDTNLLVFKKLAVRVNDCLSETILHNEPKHIDLRLILVALNNRDGTPPHVQHLHFGIIKSLVVNAFDPHRPAIGICIKFVSVEGKKKRLLEHNKRFTTGVTLLPIIDEDMALYGSLASSHFNLTLRILQSGMTSPYGDISGLLDEQPALKEVVCNGHKWWVRPETTEKALQVDIRLWRNQDQNENQGTHEMEILQAIAQMGLNLSNMGLRKVQMADLVAKASRKNPSVVSVGTWNTLAKVWVMCLNNDAYQLVGELVDYHAHKVNPKTLYVSISYFASIACRGLDKCPLLRHYLLVVNYTTEKVTNQPSGIGLASFMEPKDLEPFFKKQPLVDMVEKELAQASGTSGTRGEDEGWGA